jgi:hypothetical protein
MELYASPEMYERVIHYDEDRELQVVEYIHVRKYFLSFDEEWCPTPDGIAFPLDMDNTRELFRGLVEILSLAESKEIIQEEFSELLQDLYTK